MPAGYAIAPARPEQVPALVAIELEAATRYRGWPVPDALFSEARDLAELHEAQRAGRLWVALDAAGKPVGFALVERVGGVAHLEEMDVLPAHGRRGVGRALLETVCAWARDAGLAAVTLTTFREVPWNAPFYARLGFRELAPDQLDPELARRLAREARWGLDPSRRVAMRRELGTQ